MALEFGPITPVLRVRDVTASIDYYVHRLGFKLDWRDDDGNSFASVSRGRCHVFLTAGDQGNGGAWVWMAVSDSDELHRELLANGAKIRTSPANFPWGSREMQVEDLDGNVFRFGSANKPGEPFGEWLDMYGVRWRHETGGGWTRVAPRTSEASDEGR